MIGSLRKNEAKEKSTKKETKKAALDIKLTEGITSRYQANKSLSLLAANLLCELKKVH